MAGFLCSLVSMVPLPGLLMHASPWAANASESAFYLLETAHGRYSSGLLVEWVPSEESSVAGAASSVPDHSTVWTDGSLVLDRFTGVSSSGAGFFAHQSAGVVVGGVMLIMYGLMVVFSLVRGFVSVPGPLQSVQRAEMWGDSGFAIFWCCPSWC